jgi:hypothetical protein
MKRLLVLFVVLFVVAFTYTAIAQKMGALKKGISLNFPEKIQKAVLDPLPEGTYTIGAGGHFPTIDSAFNKLSIDGIAGEVTLELIDNLYTTPTGQYGFFLNGPIPGTGPNSRVTIKPALNKNVTIEGSNEEVVCCLNTSYVTFDGVGLTGTTTLTVYALFDPQFEWNDCLDFYNNSDQNIIQNIIFVCDDISRWGGGANIWNFFSGSNESPDSNIVQYNLIKKGSVGVSIGGNNSPVRAIGNIINGNIIGSETDSLIAWGIFVWDSQNTIIENNTIQNLKIVRESMVSGINIYDGSSDIIRNNIVHDLKANSGYTSVGILLSGDVGYVGNNNLVYNNMVYDIQSTSTASDSRVAGIQMWQQNSPKIYYNTVYLSGNGTNHQGSAALYTYSWGTCANIDARDNILINTRAESPYCASAIYLNSGSSFATSNYNDLYYEPNQYNCVVRIGSTDYQTLADWQATGKDLNSIFEMPNFIDPYLHIDPAIPTNIESHATPIAGIITDFDSDLRNVNTPDIGADEINGIVLPVELTSFTAEALDQKIILKWTTATELNNNGFEIQRRVTESEFATIGFVKGEGTTTNQKEYSYIDKELVDGKYLYRLKQIDFNGSYEYSNVIEVDVRSLNEYALEQNYPNPFNPVTTIGYVLKEKRNAQLMLYNAIGEEVAVLVNEEQDKGFHKVDFNAVYLPSGVYFYRLNAGSYSSVKKMILLR